jgi:presenilin-like A22 family membrane protease
MVVETREKKQELIAVFIMGLFFLLVYSLSIILVQPFISSDVIEPAFKNPDDPFNILYIFLIMLIFTIIILLIARFWKKQLIQFIILGAIGYTAFYAFFLPIFTITFFQTEFIFQLIISLLCSIILVAVLFRFPEWYIIDITGIIIGTCAIIIFGISLNVFLVILLLVGLAIYDAISVYKTKHMIDLADTVMDLKLPVLLVVPKVRNYSLIKETKRLKEQLKENEEREAFFMGLGDIVMPGILIETVYISSPQGLVVALGATIGTIIGFGFLMRFVLTGRPQAGLPLLCGGAILGYIITSIIFYRTFIGISLPI